MRRKRDGDGEQPEIGRRVGVVSKKAAALVGRPDYAGMTFREVHEMQMREMREGAAVEKEPAK